MLKQDNRQAAKTKPPGVKITSFKPLALPGSLGNINIVVFGLGDDGLIYQWDNKTKEWLLG